MSNSPSPDALTLLTYALDEMRETIALIPVAELSRSAARPFWRNVFFAFARSRGEVDAGFAVQYLTENLERSRGHWHEALSLLDELQREHSANETILQLGDALREAGVDEVLPRLQDDALPHTVDKTGAHLAAVVATIHECDRILHAARNKLLLQRIRNE
jgi:hypothetical protein